MTPPSLQWPSLHPAPETLSLAAWMCLCACSGIGWYTLQQSPAAGVSRVGIFSVEPKSLAHRSGAESRHVGTFICELRNRETKDASQIPPTDRLRGINNTHTHIHTPVQIAINNATLSKAFMLMSAEKQLSLHAKLHHCTKRSASFSSPSPFKVTYITL